MKNFYFILFCFILFISRDHYVFSWIEDQPLNIFVVPFSLPINKDNLDLDTYYESNGKHIISSIVDNLVKDHERKFIWPELFYFRKWWNDPQFKSKHSIVKQLIQNKQIEFVNNGIYLNENYNNSYQYILNDLKEGSEWIVNNLGGPVVKSFLNIHSNGHSEAFSYFLSLSGIENIVLQKINRDLKNQLKSEKHLEFFWQDSMITRNQSNNEPFKLFTHILPDQDIDIKHTCGPNSEICQYFDFYNNDHKITHSNIQMMGDNLLQQYKSKALLYRSNCLLILLGGENMYKDVSKTNDLLDKYQQLFNYIKSSNENINIRFSTLGEYFDNLKQSRLPINLAPAKSFSNIDIILQDQYKNGQSLSQLVPGQQIIPDTRDFLIFKGDFFGISNDKNQYLSFSSNQQDNDLDLKLNNLLKVLNNLLSLDSSLDFQSKQVAFNQIEQCKSTPIMYKNQCINDMEGLLSSLTSQSLKCNSNLNLTNSNEIIPISLIDTYSVVLFNSLELKKEELVSIFIDSPYVELYNENQSPVLIQISPIWNDTINTLIDNRFLLSFIVEIQPFSTITYTLHLNMDQKEKKSQSLYYSQSTILSILGSTPKSFKSINPFVINFARLGSQELVLDNNFFKIKLNHLNGLFETIVINNGGKNKMDIINFEESHWLYQSESGHYQNEWIENGNLIKSEISNSLIRIVKGPIFNEIIIFKNSNSRSSLQSISIKLLNCLDPFKKECIDGSKMIKYESTFNQFKSKQVGDNILRFSIKSNMNINNNNLNINDISNLNHLKDKELKKNNIYFSDSNGFSLIPRKSNIFGSNSYHSQFIPMTSVAYFGQHYSVSSGLKAGVFCKNMLGITSIKDGSLDLMLNKFDSLKNRDELNIVSLWLSFNDIFSTSFPFSKSNHLKSPIQVFSFPNSYTTNKCTFNHFIPTIKIPNNLQFISLHSQFNSNNKDDGVICHLKLLNVENSIKSTLALKNQLQISSLFPNHEILNVVQGNLQMTKVFDISTKTSIRLTIGELVSLSFYLKELENDLIVIDNQIPSTLVKNDESGAGSKSLSRPVIDASSKPFKEVEKRLKGSPKFSSFSPESNHLPPKYNSFNLRKNDNLKNIDNNNNNNNNNNQIDQINNNEKIDSENESEFINQQTNHEVKSKKTSISIEIDKLKQEFQKKTGNLIFKNNKNNNNNLEKEITIKPKARLDRKAGLSALELQILQLEKDFELEKVIIKAQMKQLKKKPINPAIVYSKQYALDYIIKQEKTLLEIKEQISNNPGLLNKPLEEHTDGALVLGKKIPEMPKKYSGSNQFYLLVILLCFSCITYLLFYLTRRQRKPLSILQNQHQLSTSSSSSSTSIIIDIEDNKIE
ncbi:hypothetical protein CYY_007000 [Polysphondylium violaceum]|uniref:alpha-mannosidase n=1 Tax=Polysphondylium violaceum TaxID=133409 RepID=A0A8J4V597_9MYCE|nr:hypothetical protein CYY_007000 [Polysphondylium violaceum]